EALGLVGRVIHWRPGVDVELPAGLPFTAVDDPTGRGVVDRESVTRQPQLAERLHQRPPLRLDNPSQQTGPIRIHRQSRWYEEGPSKGPLGLLEVQLTLVLVALEFLLFADVPSDLDFVQPDGTHAVAAGPETPAQQRPFRVQQLPVDPGRALALE